MLRFLFWICIDDFGDMDVWVVFSLGDKVDDARVPLPGKELFMLSLEMSKVCIYVASG